jgi:hypothetical protein
VADAPEITEMMRRAVQLNARLYKGWIDLSVDYMRGLAEIFGDAPTVSSSGASMHGSDVSDVELNGGAVVLESSEGEQARAAFLVTNDLGRVLTCELMSSEFVARTGERVPADVSFEPAKFQLAPGQQQVVQVATKLDGRLQPGVAYSGTFAIRGLDGYTVAAVLRRTHAAVDSPISTIVNEAAQQHATAEHHAAPEPTTGRSSKSGGQKSTGNAPKRRK